MRPTTLYELLENLNDELAHEPAGSVTSAAADLLNRGSTITVAERAYRLVVD